MMPVYFAAVLGVSLFSQGLFVLVIIGSAGLVHLVTVAMKVLRNGRIITLDGSRKSYRRRLDLAHEPIQETRRHSWALKLGIVNKDNIPGTSQEQEREGEASFDVLFEVVIM
jgi:hypothetical protein